MDVHLKVASVLHIGLGILGILASLFILLGFSVISFLIGMNAPSPEALPVVSIVAVIGFFITGLTMISPLFGVAAGVGMYKRAQWGRILGIVASILYLPVHFPFGAILGVYTLWILLSSEANTLFDNRSSF
ncbi:MAG: hypothetical protein JXR73_17055 [Candidatus Omnitrophica bacterium]|nr:hypothetical protein [Candidatus Omnitrophota bacterium]